jgi:hypothetical protein
MHGGLSVFHFLLLFRLSGSCRWFAGLWIEVWLPPKVKMYLKGE